MTQLQDDFVARITLLCDVREESMQDEARPDVLVLDGEPIMPQCGKVFANDRIDI